MKSIFELFIKQKIEFKFVLFSIGQTLFRKYFRSFISFHVILGFVIIEIDF